MLKTYTVAIVKYDWQKPRIFLIYPCDRLRAFSFVPFLVYTSRDQVSNFALFKLNRRDLNNPQCSAALPHSVSSGLSEHEE